MIKKESRLSILVIDRVGQGGDCARQEEYSCFARGMLCKCR